MQTCPAGKGKRHKKMKEQHLTGLEDRYVVYDNKRLRLGYTTGSCAAAASKAAVSMLLTGVDVDEVALETPKGILLHLLIEEIRIERDERGTPVKASCAVRKDGGDDIDATNGILVFSEVTRIPEEKPDTNRETPAAASENEKGVWVDIDGGIGVGRVTRPGLDQPVGNAAINHVPREMITREIREVCRSKGYTGGISVIISIPEGEKVAEKTFNPRLGIVGGISVLGTSGIVLPMSEKALVDTIRVEMNVHRNAGAKYLLITPGNFGERFASEMPGLDRTYEMKCSNFVGETIDMAADMGISGILFVAHIGKFIKLSGGIMNTHSHEADCRAELMAAQAVRAGADAKLAAGILATNTTEDALKLLLEEGGKELFDATCQKVMERIEFYLNARAAGKMKMGAVVFSNIYGKLGETSLVPELLEGLKDQVK